MTLLLGCNQILGNHDLPSPAATPDAPAGCGDCTCVVDTDCGAHMYCDVEPTSSVCSCVAGYGQGADGCAWTGVTVNPGFEATTGWTLGSDTTIDPAYAVTGMFDPGVRINITRQLHAGDRDRHGLAGVRDATAVTGRAARRRDQRSDRRRSAAGAEHERARGRRGLEREHPADHQLR